MPIDYYQNYDVIFKWIATVFTGKTLDVLGIKSGKIVEVRGLEPITMQVQEERVDILLKDDQNHYYHIEEERNLSRKDIFRFAIQHFLISEQIKSEELTSVIVASGVTTPMTSIKTASGFYKPTIINLEERDGEQRLAEIQRQEEPNEVELVFLPLYGVKSKDRQTFAQEVVFYAKELHQKGKLSLDFLGAIVVMCNKLVSLEVLKSLWEEVSMLQVFKHAEEIGKEAGKIEMLKEMLLTLLEVKFKEEAAFFYPDISKLENLEQLIMLRGVIKTTNDITKVREALNRFKNSR